MAASSTNQNNTWSWKWLMLNRTVQLQLLQRYWLGHRLGLPWYWMVCLGNEQRSLCRLWDCIQIGTSLVAQTGKHLSTMQETRVRSLGQEDPLEKEMAIHSSILAWKIPWTEEPGWLQSMGMQRVRHDWVPSLHFTAFWTLLLTMMATPFLLRDSCPQ